MRLFRNLGKTILEALKVIGRCCNVLLERASQGPAMREHVVREWKKRRDVLVCHCVEGGKWATVLISSSAGSRREMT